VVSTRAPKPDPADDEFTLTRAALTETSGLYRALSEPTPSSAFPTLTPRSRASHSKKARSERKRSEAAARSEAARSEAARSEAARSEAARSEAARSEAARSEVSGSEAIRSDAAHSTEARSGAGRSGAGQSGAGQSGAGQSALAGAAGAELSVPARRETRAARRRRGETATGARHSAARPAGRLEADPAGGRAETRRPPAAGAHRAPGTLPIESWVRIGKKRQQVLLASLVAAALLVIGFPMRQQGIDAVDAAAAKTVGVHLGKNKAKPKDSKPAHDAGAADPRTTSPAPKPSTSTAPKAPATEVKVPAGGLGPGHSLRTTGSKAISLTFDDGPDPVQTPKILALLAKYHVKATFCLIGSNVQRNPEIVREIVAAGHTLCNHTWNHSLTIGKDKPEDIRADLERTNAAIRAAVPGADIPFFRAPGGNFTDRLVDVAKAQGMTSLYWQVDPRDWDHPKGETDPAHVARVVTAIRKSVKPGSIILSHDFNQPDTIEAYTKLMPWITKTFTTTIPPQTAPRTPPAPAVTPSSPPASAPAGTDPAGPADPANAATDAASAE